MSQRTDELKRLDHRLLLISGYVRERVDDTETFRRIVTEVLMGNTELFVQPEESEDMKRLETAADRLLAREAMGQRGG